MIKINEKAEKMQEKGKTFYILPHSTFISWHENILKIDIFFL
jgi:hypothetical protein